MSRYPDFIQRLFVHERTLDEPLPKEPTDYELVIRIREADDADDFRRRRTAARRTPGPGARRVVLLS